MKKKKIINYKVLASTGDVYLVETLEKKVKEYINEGWQPYGDIKLGTDSHGICMAAQAIVQYEE